MIKNREVVLVINTTEARKGVIADSRLIRVSALQGRVPYYTTIAGARAAVAGMQASRELTPFDLRGLHAELPAT
jgi:carbamoyl-phosphate synthase large subunit